MTITVSAKSPSIRFEGADGWIECRGWRGSLRASQREMLDVAVDPEKVKIYRPSEIGHCTITIAHIGNVTMLLGRKLQWNPQKEDFVGDAEASAMLTRRQREPWTLANIDKWI